MCTCKGGSSSGDAWQAVNTALASTRAPKEEKEYIRKSKGAVVVVDVELDILE